MECNKEEAFRAKEIAEKKMQAKDFAGAKKVALKAQQLFSDIENITQILTVCEVHCSAGARVNGEVDWYGILQVEQAADDSIIKKQYRKLALLLHPDKNKFAGAEAAFKLIGEAHMTLSDRAKRSVYDMKRKANMTTALARQPAHQPNVTSFTRKSAGVQNNFTSTGTFEFGSTNLQQSSGPNSRTFWTMCPNCCMKFQYYRSLLNRSMRCHRCLTHYVAAELSVGEVPCSQPRHHTSNAKQEVPLQTSCFGNASSVGVHGDVAGGSQSGISTAYFNTGSTNKQKEHGVAGGTTNTTVFDKVKTGKAGKKQQSVKSSAANARKRKGRKVAVESSDSESNTSSEDILTEDDCHAEEQTAGSSSRCSTRRSCRTKKNVTYQEGGREDDDVNFVSPPKRSRKVESSNRAENATNDHRKNTSFDSVVNGGESVKKTGPEQSETEDILKAKTGSDVDAAIDSDSDDAPHVMSFSSPDPEFYNFEQERDPSKFAAGQIWALYDDADAMPRFYAMIREVCNPFRLRYTWLEHNPIGELEKVWTHEELPVSCGNYRTGTSEDTDSLQMFSHQICWNKGKKRNTYDVYPRKDEVWALFKGWDAGWSSDADNHRLYDYEVVEVLSDTSDNDRFEVIHLMKVEGFVSLFLRSSASEKFSILPVEVLRFSHRVPSYRMSQGEREGIPEGSLELDTASLPDNFGESFPSINLNAASVKAQKLDADDCDLLHGSRISDKIPTSSPKKRRMKLNEENATDAGCKGLSPERVNSVSRNEGTDVAAECPISSSMRDSVSTSRECSKTWFHNFQEDKRIQMFRKGQIWALYCNLDALPKYYAVVKKVDADKLKISVSWVELLPQRDDEHEWKKKTLPATCGRFKIDHGSGETFGNVKSFSHLVQARPTTKRKGQYDIYPRLGEIWAVYKDWNVGWGLSDVLESKYHVVEILEAAGSVVKARILTKDANYKAVFMPDMGGGAEHTIGIPLAESLRFSHQIPAFRLTDEAGSAVQGFWELDSLSLPPI